jgi:hypothetical protein
MNVPNLAVRFAPKVHVAWVSILLKYWLGLRANSKKTHTRFRSVNNTFRQPAHDDNATDDNETGIAVVAAAITALPPLGL